MGFQPWASPESPHLLLTTMRRILPTFAICFVILTSCDAEVAGLLSVGSSSIVEELPSSSGSGNKLIQAENADAKAGAKQVEASTIAKDKQIEQQTIKKAWANEKSKEAKLKKAEIKAKATEKKNEAKKKKAKEKKVKGAEKKKKTKKKAAEKKKKK